MKSSRNSNNVNSCESMRLTIILETPLVGLGCYRSLATFGSPFYFLAGATSLFVRPPTVK
jgi:hypothetical protein